VDISCDSGSILTVKGSNSVEGPPSGGLGDKRSIDSAPCILFPPPPPLAGYGGDPDSTGETTLDAMVFDGLCWVPAPSPQTASLTSLIVFFPYQVPLIMSVLWGICVAFGELVCCVRAIPPSIPCDCVCSSPQGSSSCCPGCVGTQ
jgi:hypothetical protein